MHVPQTEKRKVSNSGCQMTKTRCNTNHIFFGI